MKVAGVCDGGCTCVSNAIPEAFVPMMEVDDCLKQLRQSEGRGDTSKNEEEQEEEGDAAKKEEAAFTETDALALIDKSYDL
jgi:hypothetical protein